MLVTLKSGDPAFEKEVAIAMPNDGIVDGSRRVEVATIGKAYDCQGARVTATPGGATANRGKGSLRHPGK
jgi:hypothetical protein